MNGAKITNRTVKDGKMYARYNWKRQEKITWIVSDESFGHHRDN